MICLYGAMLFLSVKEIVKFYISIKLVEYITS